MASLNYDQIFRQNDFIILFVTYIRRILENAYSITISEFGNDPDIIENVHQKATNLVHGMQNLPYEERIRGL